MLTEENLTKDEHIVNFIKAFSAIEEAMEPFKEQRKELRENYSENDWLTKQDMRLAVKAYRLIQQGADMEQLTDYFNNLKRKVSP